MSRWKLIPYFKIKTTYFNRRHHDVYQTDLFLLTYETWQFLFLPPFLLAHIFPIHLQDLCVRSCHVFLAPPEVHLSLPISDVWRGSCYDNLAECCTYVAELWFHQQTTTVRCLALVKTVWGHTNESTVWIVTVIFTLLPLPASALLEQQWK